MGRRDPGGKLLPVRVLEIELGALQIARRDAAQGAVLRRWIYDPLLPRFEARILAVDTAVARRCARLRVPDRRLSAQARRGVRSGRALLRVAEEAWEWLVARSGMIDDKAPIEMTAMFPRLSAQDAPPESRAAWTPRDGPIRALD